MAMLMVIVGAGASHDSAPGGHGVEIWRPPLGNGLFPFNLKFYGDAVDRFEDVRYLAQRLGPLPEGRGLEEELEILQERSKTYPLLRRQLTAMRFYLQQVLSGGPQQWSRDLNGRTNYVGLVNEIDQMWPADRGVCYVSFNYDVLLDGALGTIDVFFGDMNSYINQPRYRLIKPHGSVNWWHEVKGPTAATRDRSVESLVIRNIDALTVDPAIRSDPNRGTSLWLPALAIPVASKTQFELPDDHLESFRAATRETTHLLLIGWKANEARFLDELRHHIRPNPKTMIVGRNMNSANAIGTKVLKTFDVGALTYFDSDFSRLMKRPALSAFLLS